MDAMNVKMHASDTNGTPYWREPFPKPDLNSDSRSDSFESLLSLNVLASSLLEEATDLEDISQSIGSLSYIHDKRLTRNFDSDRHITLPYFSTQVVGAQPYRFDTGGGSKEDKGKGVSFDFQEASFSPGKPLERKRRFGHNRQASNATTASSAPGSQDYDSFLSRSTATHSTKNTSYGSHAAFAKPDESTSYLPTPLSQQTREQAAVSAESQARRLSAVSAVQEGRPFSSLATVAGMDADSDIPHATRSTPRSPTATKIGDWLRQQYENGSRSAHSTPSTLSVSTFASPVNPSDDEHVQPSSSQTSPASTSSKSHRQTKALSSPQKRGSAYRTSSQKFRQALLEEIIETDFADPDIPPRPPSRDLLWHPTEYVGPLRRSKTSAASNRPANHRRHRSADLLQQAQTTPGEESEKRQSWLANTLGRASMNDLLLRPANDPARQNAEKGIKRKSPFASFGRRPSHAISRSLSNLSSFFGFRSSSSSASTPPPGISSNGTFVVHNHQHPRMRTPSFVVHSRSPPARNTAKLPNIDTGREYEDQALSSPISLDTFDGRAEGDTRQSEECQTQYQATLSRYRRSLKRLTSSKRQPRGEPVQVTERRKAEADRLAGLAQEQVARDANVRAQIVDRFTSPLRRNVQEDGV